MSRPRFFAPQADAAPATVALPADEAHHLAHVLRLRAGAEIAVFDGRGHEWRARVAQVGRRAGASVEILDPVTPVAEPPVLLTLGVGVLKGDRMDAVVRDATMLGVAAIVPVLSERVVVAAGALKGPKSIERWQRIAVASAKQCGRAVVPAIASVMPLAQAFESPVEARLFCVEPGHTAAHPVSAEPTRRPASALALIGPEGGWSPAEVALAQARGAQLIHLGPRVLRAETAPTVLLSALWTMWGW